MINKSVENGARASPYDGNVKGTRQILRQEVSIFKLPEKNLERTSWERIGKGFAFLFDTQIFGIHHFGLWLKSEFKWLAKRTVQECELEYDDNYIQELFWTLPTKDEKLYYAIRFPSFMTAKQFIIEFQFCARKAVLQHNNDDVSDMSENDRVLTRDLDNTLPINPFQRYPFPDPPKVLPSYPRSVARFLELCELENENSLEHELPMPYLNHSQNESLMTKTNASVRETDEDESTTIDEYSQGSDADDEKDQDPEYSSVFEIPKYHRGNQVGVIKIREVGNNLPTKLITNMNIVPRPQVLVHITDRNDVMEKTYLLDGRVRNHYEAFRIIKKLRLGRLIHGKVVVTNIPYVSPFSAIMSMIIEYLTSKITIVSPRIHVLELEVDTLLLWRNKKLKKTAGIVFLNHKTGRITRDYPMCLDMECLEAKDRYNTPLINPKRILRKIKKTQAEAETKLPIPVVPSGLPKARTSKSSASGSRRRKRNKSLLRVHSDSSIQATLESKTSNKFKSHKLNTKLVLTPLRATPDKAEIIKPKLNVKDKESDADASSGLSGLSLLTTSTFSEDSELSDKTISMTESMAMKHFEKMYTGRHVESVDSDWGKAEVWHEAENFETGHKSRAYKDLKAIVKKEAALIPKPSFFRRTKNFFSTAFGIRSRAAKKRNLKATNLFRAALYPNLTVDEVEEAVLRTEFKGVAAELGFNLGHQDSNIGLEELMEKYDYEMSDSTPTELYSEEEGGPKELMGTSNLLRNLRSTESSTSSFSVLSGQSFRFERR